MARILMIGYVPPPFCGDSKIEAAHYRTWQFLDPLLQDGHVIHLCAESLPGTATPQADALGAYANLTLLSIRFGSPGWSRTLQSLHDTFRPDCVLAIGPCLQATKLQTHRPIWMDVYGDSLTIMQAAAYRRRSDRGILTTIDLFGRVLRRGDIFSVSSVAQAHALVGELAMAGRLNARTFGYSFVEVVRPGALVGARNHLRGVRSALQEHGICERDFVVLWCGGYNTWTDVKTLFQGLEIAMRLNSHLHYVSVGASTYVAGDNTYLKFVEMVNTSSYRERYHMLGWRPWKEVSQYYCESDVGINIDAMHYETVYGTRTRLVEMMAAGLPVITSLGSEVSYELKAHDAAVTFDTGDASQLANRLATLSEDEQCLARLAQRTVEYAENNLSFSETTRSVREWVRSPRVAPDHEVMSFGGRLRQFEFWARSKARGVIWELAGLDK